MGRNWELKDRAQAQLSNLTKEENKLRDKYGIEWRKEANKDELGYIYQLEDEIDWGQLD